MSRKYKTEACKCPAGKLLLPAETMCEKAATFQLTNVYCKILVNLLLDLQ